MQKGFAKLAFTAVVDMQAVVADKLKIAQTQTLASLLLMSPWLTARSESRYRLLYSYMGCTASQSQAFLKSKQTFMVDGNAHACHTTAENSQMHKHIWACQGLNMGLYATSLMTSVSSASI
jgi:hypothetical protein